MDIMEQSLRITVLVDIAVLLLAAIVIVPAIRKNKAPSAKRQKI